MKPEQEIARYLRGSSEGRDAIKAERQRLRQEAIKDGGDPNKVTRSQAIKSLVAEEKERILKASENAKPSWERQGGSPIGPGVPMQPPQVIQPQGITAQKAASMSSTSKRQGSATVGTSVPVFYFGSDGLLYTAYSLLAGQPELISNE